MNDLLSRPELAMAAALVVALLWATIFFAHKISEAGAEDQSDRPWLADVPAADRYARFEHRDYSGDRGPIPTRKPRLPTGIFPDVFEQLMRERGWDR